MVTDEAGIMHPDMTDERTTSGLIHIARCLPCRDKFGPFVAAVADDELALHTQELGWTAIE